MAEDEEVRYRAWPTLGGCTIDLVFTSRANAQRAVVQLSTCKAHGGCHHFAVTGEGLHVAMSPVGLTCLEQAGVLAVDP